MERAFGLICSRSELQALARCQCHPTDTGDTPVPPDRCSRKNGYSEGSVGKRTGRACCCLIDPALATRQCHPPALLDKPAVAPRGIACCYARRMRLVRLEASKPWSGVAACLPSMKI